MKGVNDMGYSNEPEQTYDEQMAKDEELRGRDEDTRANGE